MNGSEVVGDLALIQTSLLLFSFDHANRVVVMLTCLHLRFVSKQGHRQPRFQPLNPDKSATTVKWSDSEYMKIHIFELWKK